MLFYTVMIILLFIENYSQVKSLPLSIYCENVTRICNCESEGNSVAIRCLNEFTLLVELIENITLHMSYYKLDTFENVPRLNIKKIKKLDIDAHNFWNRTMLTNFLAALAIDEVETLVIRDRMHFKKNGKWAFSAINGLQHVKLNSDVENLSETIFDSFENLISLELNLDMKKLPVALLRNLKNLKELKIQNEQILYFNDSLISRQEKLQNFTLRINEKKSKRLHLHLFKNMNQLKEVHLIHALDKLPKNMFKGSYNLILIQIIENEYLNHLPIDLLADQTNLIKLDLQKNAIGNLDIEFFMSLRSLQVLDLSCNKIDKLHTDVFGPLKNLKTLKLNYNPLTQIDAGIFRNTLSLNLVDMCGTQFYGTHLDMTYEALLCINNDMCHYRANDWECPEDCICWVDRNCMKLVVECSSTERNKFLKLPSTTLVPTSLKLENNSLSTLPYRTELGYANVTELYLAKNQIKIIKASQLPENLTYLDISRNQITQFNDDLIEYLSKTRLNLKLAGNPLECDCAAISLLRFIRSYPSRIKDLNQVYCANIKFRKTFQQLDLRDICPSKVLLIAGIVGGLVVIICISLVLYFMYEQPIRIWLYNHNLCLWYVSEDELDKDKLYDAFISYSHKDEELISKILPLLESGPHPFKICLHGRDWLVGDCIPERIVYTVAESKRIIIILSQNFLDSVWARMEFRIAYQATLEDRRKRIIIILYKDIENMDGVSCELKAYLKLNTYLKWGDPQFWNKLRYAMPHNKRLLKEEKSWLSMINR